MQSKNKPAMTVRQRAHVERVKSLDCSVCNAAGPCDAHEIEQGAWFTSVALCKSCHQGPLLGLHGQRRMWLTLKMTELLALDKTIERLCI